MKLHLNKWQENRFFDVEGGISFLRNHLDELKNFSSEPIMYNVCFSYLQEQRKMVYNFYVNYHELDRFFHPYIETVLDITDCYTLEII